MVAAAQAARFAEVAHPAFAQGRRYYPEREGAFRIHLGAFQPDGESEYWENKEEDFTGSVDDFENAVFGLDYLLPLNRRLSLVFSGSVYEGDSTNSYRDFEDNFGGRIRHDTTLSLASGTVGLMLHLTGPDTTIQPYVGVGGGMLGGGLPEPVLHALNFALSFAVHRMDHDAAVIYEATLLHDFAQRVVRAQRWSYQHVPEFAGALARIIGIAPDAAR